MTLKLIEGADHFSSELLATEKGWNIVSLGIGPTVTFQLGPGRIAGNALTITDQFADSNGATLDHYWIKSMAATLDHFVLGFAFQTTELPGPGNSNEIFFLLTAGGVKAFRVFLNSNGSISVQNSGGTVIATGTAMLTTYAYHFIEFKVIINGAAGNITTQVDGVQDIASTVGNFGSTAIRDVCPNFVPQNGNTQRGLRVQSYDDIYVLDTNSAPNNDFLGDCHAYTLYANGAGTTTQWTPLAGSNWQEVNEHTVAPYPDGDTTYVSTSTVNNIDTYAFDDLPFTTGTVFAVQTNLVARKSDANLRQIAPVIRRTGVNYVGNNFTLAVSYVDGLQIYETDPSTAAQWTVAGVNAAEFGEKLTT